MQMFQGESQILLYVSRNLFDKPTRIRKHLWAHYIDGIVVPTL
jgi:hypothetical protein